MRARDDFVSSRFLIAIASFVAGLKVSLKKMRYKTLHVVEMYLILLHNLRYQMYA